MICAEVSAHLPAGTPPWQMMTCLIMHCIPRAMVHWYVWCDGKPAAHTNNFSVYFGADSCWGVWRAVRHGTRGRLLVNGTLTLSPSAHCQA